MDNGQWTMDDRKNRVCRHFGLNSEFNIQPKAKEQKGKGRGL